MQRLIPTFLTLLVGLVVGCGGRETVEKPATHKVAGVVLRKDGKPLSGGAIEFRNVAKPEHTTVGEIDANGRFTLQTIHGSSGTLAGAQEGEHRVTVMLPQNEKGEGETIELTKTYNIKSGDNDLTIKLER